MKQRTAITRTNYAGNYVYENDALQFFSQPEGYVEPKGLGWEYVFQYKDHLGNVRLSYSDTDLNDSIDPSTEIIEEKNYYPFGGIQKGYNNVVNGTAHPYGFGGKEENDELGLQWMDFGSRNYDKWLGRWMNIDMKAEAYYPITPYQYVLNNPIVNEDHNGQWTVTRHYNMTYNALSAAGIGKKQADLLAHYSAVYADNPGSHIKANNIAHPTNQQHYRDNIDYSGTSLSQETRWNPKSAWKNFNVWHSMRSPWEDENNSISAAAATERGMQFGWSKVFESAESGSLNDLTANSSGIEAFGQGLHALQDAYAHKGRSDVGVGHLWNDRYGDTSQAENISESAVTVHNLLSGNYGAFKGSNKISFTATGMTSAQLSQAMQAVLDYLSQNKKEEENKD